MNRAVFLDRDGVINRSVIRDGKSYPPPTLAEMEFFPGVDRALKLLDTAGFLRIVVTNQPDVATGVQRQEVVESMHQHIRATLAVDDIKVCYHVNEHQCACRKPKPGMLLDAAQDWNIDLQRSYMVGDRWRDIDAGANAGCKTIWLKTDYAEHKPDQPDMIVNSLWEASLAIMEQEGLDVADLVEKLALPA
jgi:D-glycero-D-manno-heptose 1,7-bisphosphate phosphatase